MLINMELELKYTLLKKNINRTLEWLAIKQKIDNIIRKLGNKYKFKLKKNNDKNWQYVIPIWKVDCVDIIDTLAREVEHDHIILSSIGRYIVFEFK